MFFTKFHANIKIMKTINENYQEAIARENLIMFKWKTINLLSIGLATGKRCRFI